MYPGTHALTTPDKPAVIMAGSQEVVTYRDLAKFKAPKSVDFVSSLPRTATGKLVKRELTLRYSGAPAAT